MVSWGLCEGCKWNSIVRTSLIVWKSTKIFSTSTPSSFSMRLQSFPAHMWPQGPQRSQTQGHKPQTQIFGPQFPMVDEFRHLIVIIVALAPHSPSKSVRRPALFHHQWKRPKKCFNFIGHIKCNKAETFNLSKVWFWNFSSLSDRLVHGSTRIGYTRTRTRTRRVQSSAERSHTPLPIIQP